MLEPTLTTRSLLSYWFCQNAPRRRAKNENKCDITGRYQYIKTLCSYASETPLYDVGQVSYDCYDIPDKVFASGSEQDFLTDETVDFLVDAFHHPVLVTAGVMHDRGGLPPQQPF
jgi:hypothetical protein